MKRGAQVLNNLQNFSDAVMVSESGVGVGKSAVWEVESPNTVVVLVPEYWVYAVRAPDIDNGGGRLPCFAAGSSEPEADIVIQIEEAGGGLNDEVSLVIRVDRSCAMEVLEIRGEDLGAKGRICNLKGKNVD